MMCHSPAPPLKQRCGFNLLEAAIVLGVVGLVIGGIWVAAAQVKNNLMANNAVTTISQVAHHLTTQLPREMYPSACCSATSLNTLIQQTFPEFRSAGGFLYSRDNIRMSVTTTYVTSPIIDFMMWATSDFPTALCNQVIARLGANLKDRSVIDYVQFNASATTFLYPPYTASQVSCPSDLSYVEIRYKAAP